MEIDNYKNHNEDMDCVSNGENSANLENRNHFIGNEQLDLLKMDNITKESVGCEDCINQKEAAWVSEESNHEDNVRYSSEADNSAVSEEPNHEDKMEALNWELNRQMKQSDRKTVANYKDPEPWNHVFRSNKRHVKRYLDEPSDQMVIFSSRAFNSIVSETYAKDPVETGGIMLGYVLDNGFWIVTEIIPPGKESVNKYAYFEYDTEFVNYVANRVARQFKNPPQVLGIWHRHPGSMDTFSSVDDGTNATFSNINSPYGAISALVNLDPEFRITIYHATINEYNQAQYQKMTYEVGDEYIPDEYCQLKYVAGTNKTRAVQDVNSNDVTASEETKHVCAAVEDNKTDTQQNQEDGDLRLRYINITLELILILFLSIDIAILFQNKLINSLTDRQTEVQSTAQQLDQQSEVPPAYSLTDRQTEAQSTAQPLDQQPAVSPTRSLTDRQADDKDIASLFEEWNKVLYCFNEQTELSPLDNYMNMIRPDYSQKNPNDDENNIKENINDHLTLDKTENEMKRSNRSGNDAVDSESLSGRPGQALEIERPQNDPDELHSPNAESGLPIRTAGF